MQLIDIEQSFYVTNSYKIYVFFCYFNVFSRKFVNLLPAVLLVSPFVFYFDQ